MRRLMRAVRPAADIVLLAAGAILLAAGVILLAAGVILLAAGVILLAAGAGEPVRLHPYPQKFRTFYQFTDPGIPAAVKAAPGAPRQGEACCVARAGDGAVWHGTRQGVIRIDDKGSALDRRQYFASRRYLPDDEVLNLIADNDRGVWVRTRTGISHIELRPMALDQKAEFFEKRIRERHDRYGLVASSRLQIPGELASNQLEPSDNDGLWTAMYAAAECFRYAVTRSPQALANAKKSIDAVLFLEQVTGRPGFPARSYIRKGDWRPADGVWHWTPDGRYEWKADTSSDEIVGHFFLFSVAWDLLPDENLRVSIRATATRIMDHILAHGYNLIDINGKPTTWGQWSREYFESKGGRSDSALNALEMLSFLKTAAHISGDPKYEKEYRRVAIDLKYLDQSTRYLELRDEINYSDEELAMLSFYPIFRYEHDTRFLEAYRRAAGQWWNNIERERNPLWTFIYLMAKPARPVGVDDPAWTLYRIPMDLIEWTVKNSGRSDVAIDSATDRFHEPQSVQLLPPDERPVMKWNGNPFRADGGNGGRVEDDGAFFLLPYWMGRSMGVLVE
jgi:hypothetical protein